MTTDPLDEIFPIVDENDNVIGKTTRREANSNPDIIHRAVGIMLFNEKGELLLQKRSATKDLYPNAWTVSASGHVRYAKDYLETIVSETMEEIGVKLKEKDIEFVGKFIKRAKTETEYFAVYRAKLKGDTVLGGANDEVSGLEWFSKKDIEEMLVDGKTEFTPAARRILENYL